MFGSRIVVTNRVQINPFHIYLSYQYNISGILFFLSIQLKGKNVHQSYARNEHQSRDGIFYVVGRESKKGINHGDSRCKFDFGLADFQRSDYITRVHFVHIQSYIFLLPCATFIFYILTDFEKFNYNLLLVLLLQTTRTRRYYTLRS